MTDAVARALDTRLGVEKTDAFTVHAGDVIRHLSHELRQPLSTIESIAFYLGMLFPEQPKLAAQSDRLRRLVEHMNWVLTDAVHLVQAAPVNLQVLDLHELVSNELAGQTSQGRCEFVADYAEQDALVRMDAAQASHLVRGMLLAVGNLPEDSEILVRTHTGAGSVTLEIQVPRTELSSRELDWLFTPLESHRNGSGLSLFAARRIAKAHGGSLEVSSSPQLCVRLTCSLPLAG